MFFLRKEWRDPEDGIEMVVLHWTSTQLEQDPHWQRTHPTTVMIPQPATYPVVRACPLWVTLPFSCTRLLTMDADTESRFLLHSFCEVIQRGRTWNTEVTVQEMCTKTIRHRDITGDYTHAFLYYSLDGFMQGNRASMWIEGLPSKYQFPLALPQHKANDKTYRLWAKHSRLIAQLPLPHIFRGQIWGPVGARVLYSIYLSRQGIYNPFAENGLWVLQDGRPWQIEL